MKEKSESYFQFDNNTSPMQRVYFNNYLDPSEKNKIDIMISDC